MTLQNSGSNDGQIHMMMSLVCLMTQLMRNIASLMKQLAAYIQSILNLKRTLDLIILLNQNHLKLTTVLVTAKMTFHFQLCLNFINVSHLITQLHQLGHACST